MTVGEMAFWLCAAVVFYMYAGYPLLIGLLGRLCPKPVMRGECRERCSVIISCYNESNRIRSKVEQLLSLEGSDAIVEILIGSDGSTDSPETALAGIHDSRVKLRAFPSRRGKPAVLNDLTAEASGSIILMADVRQRFSPDALVRLLENFADPSIGVVSGELVYVRAIDDTAAVEGISAYWRYEKWIRKAESRFSSVPGATGAIYAIRRSLIGPMPSGLVLDDVVFPMMAVTAGARCIFESRAIAYDVPVRDIGRESVRKRRTIAGCIQLMAAYPQWVLPWRNPIAWQYASHKLLRVFSPWLICASLCLLIVLNDNEIYRIMLYIGLGVLGLGCLGWVLGRFKLRIPFSGIIQVFAGLQLSIVHAWYDLLRGRVRPTWDVTGTRSNS